MAYKEVVWDIDKREYLCVWDIITLHDHGKSGLSGILQTLVCYFQTSIDG
jgi:hypothetical protein